MKPTCSCVVSRPGRSPPRPINPLLSCAIIQSGKMGVSRPGQSPLHPARSAHCYLALSPGRGKAHPTPPDQPTVILRYHPAGEDSPPAGAKAAPPRPISPLSSCAITRRERWACLGQSKAPHPARSTHCYLALSPGREEPALPIN